MTQEHAPVLISKNDIFDMPKGRDFGRFYPVEYFDRVLAQKREEQTGFDGAQEAAKLLLTEAAVSISLVDEGISTLTPWKQDGYLAYVAGTQLALNDHGGGSESAFKVLLNRKDENGVLGQYVLYSPPNDDDSPSNLAFHRSDFTFLTWEPDSVEFEDSVPNALKTADAAAHRNSQYEFFLFGDSNTPEYFSRLFSEIGFEFLDRPYDEALNKVLRDTHGEARDRLGYKDYERWPGDQFVGQVALLGVVETSGDTLG